jgi:hypothetical protein
MEIQTAATTTASTTGREPDSQRRGLRGHPSLTLLAVALGVMMVALDATIVAGRRTRPSSPICMRRWPGSSG